MADDYDYNAGDVTDRERLAAERQKNIGNYNQATIDNSTDYKKKNALNLATYNKDSQNYIASQNAKNTRDIANYNAKSAFDQFQKQMSNYDMANKQNEALRDTQFKQASRKSEAERFEAQRQLQNAALGLFGSMNQAMNGSTVGNTMRMLENRNDADNSTYWQQLMDNRNAVQNAYDESFNQNQIAKRDAAINALKAVQDINSDLSSNLNNINPNLYESPENKWLDSIVGFPMPNSVQDLQRLAGSNNSIYSSPNEQITFLNGLIDALSNTFNTIPRNNARLLDYVMPANAEQNVRNRRNMLNQNNYFGRLINGFNS